MNSKAINRNKLKTAFGWTVSLLLLICLTVLSVHRKSSSNISNLNIEIVKNDNSKSLIAKVEIAKKINAYLGYDLRQATIREIDLMELEEIINADERIDKAEVFIDGTDKLNVVINERKVIVRISNEDENYYLDKQGNKINVRLGRAVRVPLATGKIEAYDKSLINSRRKSNLQDIYNLAKRLEEDAFLSALIEQIDIESNGKINMVPKIGKERIRLSIEDLEEKLFKLKYFYKKGLPKHGWSKYSILDLDIRDQVVATVKN